MNKIYILSDYKGNFGSKADSSPYRSGFEKKLLSRLFEEGGYASEFLNISELNYRDIDLVGKIILYTSSEDIGYHYKDFIEDVVLYCEETGANVIPSFKYLRANNNKVFMELLGKSLLKDGYKRLNSFVFGSVNELLPRIDEVKYPVVIKESQGAQSRGVFLAKNKSDLLAKAKLISKTKYLAEDVRDKIRGMRHKEYIQESLYRNKFILQEFVPGLKNDWKILIYGSRYFILTRHTKGSDFRASGSHHNYLPGTKSLMPEGIFDYAENVFKTLNVPHLSIDVIHDGTNFYLTEFQAVYFGTSIYNMSDAYFVKEGSKWAPKPIDISLEKIYADSIISYLQKQ